MFNLEEEYTSYWLDTVIEDLSSAEIQLERIAMLELYKEVILHSKRYLDYPETSKED